MTRWYLGNPQGALAALRQAIRWAPHSRDAARRLGQYALTIGVFDDARQAADRLKALEPHDPSGWFLEALACAAAGQRAPAEQGYRILIEKFPTFYPGLWNLAELLRQQGRAEEAQPFYEAYVRVAPEPDVTARQAVEGRLAEPQGPSSLDSPQALGTTPSEGEPTQAKVRVEGSNSP